MINLPRTQPSVGEESRGHDRRVVRKLTWHRCRQSQTRELLAFLKGLPAGRRSGLETTGIYHELLANLAHRLCLVVYLLDPRDARNYGKAIGLSRRHDRVDAEIPASIISRKHEKLHVWIPPTPQQREIGQLLNRRAKLSSLCRSPGKTLERLD
jgi:transposase